MSDKDKYEKFPTSGIANVLTCVEMPTKDVLSRTLETREAGAYFMMIHLAEGNFDSSSLKIMGEFLGRVVANAQRQGVEINIPEVEPQIAGDI